MKKPIKTNQSSGVELHRQNSEPVTFHRLMWVTYRFIDWVHRLIDSVG